MAAPGTPAPRAGGGGGAAAAARLRAGAPGLRPAGEGGSGVAAGPRGRAGPGPAVARAPPGLPAPQRFQVLLTAGPGGRCGSSSAAAERAWPRGRSASGACHPAGAVRPAPGSAQSRGWLRSCPEPPEPPCFNHWCSSFLASQWRFECLGKSVWFPANFYSSGRNFQDRSVTQSLTLALALTPGGK